jgi:hypothetical protein
MIRVTFSWLLDEELLLSERGIENLHNGHEKLVGLELWQQGLWSILGDVDIDTERYEYLDTSEEPQHE